MRKKFIPTGPKILITILLIIIAASLVVWQFSAGFMSNTDQIPAVFIFFSWILSWPYQLGTFIGYTFGQILTIIWLYVLSCGIMFLLPKDKKIKPPQLHQK